MPLRTFRLRTLVAGNVVLFTAGLALDGMLFPLTLYAQQVLGYSPLQAGLLTAAMTATVVASALALAAAIVLLPRTALTRRHGDENPRS